MHEEQKACRRPSYDESVKGLLKEVNNITEGLNEFLQQQLQCERC